MVESIEKDEWFRTVKNAHFCSCSGLGDILESCVSREAISRTI
jgi:hypothetical protein